MTTECSLTAMEIAKLTAPWSLLTFILGAAFTRFTLSKKERIDLSNKKFEYGSELAKTENELATQFGLAVKNYIDKKDKGQPVGIDEFFDISTKGDKFFYHQKIAADAILSDKVDKTQRDKTLLPSIKRSVDTTLGIYYSNLKEICKNNNFPYTGDLNRNNYESMYIVVEKYCR